MSVRRGLLLLFRRCLSFSIAPPFLPRTFVSRHHHGLPFPASSRPISIGLLSDLNNSMRQHALGVSYPRAAMTETGTHVARQPRRKRRPCSARTLRSSATSITSRRRPCTKPFLVSSGKKRAALDGDTVVGNPSERCDAARFLLRCRFTSSRGSLDPFISFEKYFRL